MAQRNQYDEVANNNRRVIGRRGFFAASAIAATMAGLRGGKVSGDEISRAAACADIANWHAEERCLRTMRLICHTQLENLFRDPLDEVFTAAKPKIDAADWAKFDRAHQALIAQPRSLEYLYTKRHADWGGTLKADFDVIAPDFVFPFVERAYNDDERDAISKFLNATTANGTPYDGFFESFGRMSLLEVYSIPYNKVSPWELHLIRMAKDIGLFRLQPRSPLFITRDAEVEALEKKKCAVYSNGWSCAGSPHVDDACGMSGTELLAGSDLCGS